MRWLYLLACVNLALHAKTADEYFADAQNALEDSSQQESLLLQALETDPDHYNSLITIAKLYYDLKKTDDAITFYRKALLRKQDEHLHYNLGQAYIQKEAWYDAITHYLRALSFDPDHEHALMQLATAYERTNQYKLAIKTYQSVIKKNNKSFDALHRLGNALKHLELLEEALVPYRAAYELQPNNLHIIMELANTLNMLDQCPEALELYKKIIDINRNVISALYNYGYTMKKMGDLDGALKIYNEVLSKKADYAPARFSRSTIYLAKGDFENGWQEYEWRWQAYNEKPEKYNRPIWEGQDLTNKTLVVFAEQGLGDTLQFVRYCKYIKEQYDNRVNLIFETQSPLYDLLKIQPYFDTVISRTQKASRCDYHIPLMSLPRVLKTNSADTIPCDIPYIQADEKLVQLWKNNLMHDTNFKIGICWQGNSQYSTLSLRKAVASKSIALEMFAPLAAIPGISLYSLQHINGVDQINNCGFEMRTFNDFDGTHGRFMDTAALIKNLDLVISVDTGPCHLAGALGVPTWILLPHPPDWRWLRDRVDSIWYPNVRLFAQPVLGDWQTPMNEIIKTITYISQKNSSPRAYNIIKNNLLNPHIEEISMEKLLSQLD